MLYPCRFVQRCGVRSVDWKVCVRDSRGSRARASGLDPPSAVPVRFDAGWKGGSMILPLVAALLQVQPPAVSRPDGKPVHIWLGSSGPLLRGQPVRVYVETAADG